MVCLELQALDLAIMPLFLVLKLFPLSLDPLIHLFFSGEHILKLGQFLDAEVFSSVLVHFEDLDRAVGSSLHEAIHVWVDLCLQFLAFHRPNILDASLLFCPQPLTLNYGLLVCWKVRDVSVFVPVYTLHHVIVIFLRVDVALRRLRAHI